MTPSLSDALLGERSENREPEIVQSVVLPSSAPVSGVLTVQGDREDVTTVFRLFNEALNAMRAERAHERQLELRSPCRGCGGA